MFRTLRSRLLATYLVVVGLVLFLAGLGLILLLLRNPIADRQVYQRLELFAAVLRERADRGLGWADPERLQTQLVRFGTPEARVLVLAPDGSSTIDNRPEMPSPPAEALTAPPVGQAPARGAYRDAAGRAWLTLSERWADGRVLWIATPRPTLRALLLLGDDLLTPLVQAAILALLLSTLLAWLISRWVARPLQRMVTAARAVADGDYRANLPLAGPREVQDLSTEFNQMVSKVQQSRQAQRDFVANVSHELKTPLTSIQGFAQAILDGTAGDAAAQRHAAGVIFDESQRLHRLVEGLLDLARLDAGQAALSFASLDMAVLVQAVVERMSVPAGEKGVHLEAQVRALPSLVADGDRLAQVFTNLIDNAITHTPPGNSVRVTAVMQGEALLFSVEDSGPGIPPEEIGRIFERFYQVDRARRGGGGRGAGLGLAISREIVLAHGGTISAESTLGRGSRFTVRLPRARPGDSTAVRRIP